MFFYIFSVVIIIFMLCVHYVDMLYIDNFVYVVHGSCCWVVVLGSVVQGLLHLLLKQVLCELSEAAELCFITCLLLFIIYGLDQKHHYLLHIIIIIIIIIFIIIIFITTKITPTVM